MGSMTVLSRAHAKDWGSRLTRTCFEIALPRASRSMIQHTLASRRVCLVIAPGRQPNGITTRHAVSKRVVFCKNPFWRGVTTMISPPSITQINDAAELTLADEIGTLEPRYNALTNGTHSSRPRRSWSCKDLDCAWIQPPTRVIAQRRRVAR
jgi:hypothetical protein